MKRTKQTEIIIQTINNYLTNNQIKDESDSVFHIITYSLIQAKVYQGFNYVNKDGIICKKEECDHLIIL